MTSVKSSGVNYCLLGGMNISSSICSRRTPSHKKKKKKKQDIRPHSVSSRLLCRSMSSSNNSHRCELLFENRDLPSQEGDATHDSDSIAEEEADEDEEDENQEEKGEVKEVNKNEQKIDVTEKQQQQQVEKKTSTPRTTQTTRARARRLDQKELITKKISEVLLAEKRKTPITTTTTNTNTDTTTSVINTEVRDHDDAPNNDRTNPNNEYDNRSIISGLTEPTLDDDDDAKGGRGIRPGSPIGSPTTTARKTVAFSTRSTKAEARKKLIPTALFKPPLSPTTSATATTMASTATTADADINSTIRRKNYIPTSSESRIRRRNNIDLQQSIEEKRTTLSSLLLLRNKKNSFSTRRFELSFRLEYE